MRVRRFVMVKPAQLNSRSAAALAGSGVLSLTKFLPMKDTGSFNRSHTAAAY